jgi:FAD/FMN-containing dehydrogenase
MAAHTLSRVCPDDADWPAQKEWERLRQAVGGRLLKVQSPLDRHVGAALEPGCAELFRQLKNPYYLGDEAGLTQTLGWVGAWTSRPSEYAVAAQGTEDVVAAVNFARENNLRLVVKGGGHSYKGTSNSANSLLIWTRHMNGIALHDAFVGEGCAGKAEPAQAVTVAAGAMWGQVYDAVTTKGGRYVQGGGCMTVGVAGLIQSGGFGSFSKGFGLAAASLLEAELVTADGAVRIANCTVNPDLFWALKGGGGNFGVVTRLTLRTHDLPEYFGRVRAVIRATSRAAFRRLVARIVAFYSETLFNAHWGEQIGFRPNNVVEINMRFQGLNRSQAEAIWKPFFNWLARFPDDFTVSAAPEIAVMPARQWWDAGNRAGTLLADDRAGASRANVFWAGNLEEAGMVLHGYQSSWLPAALLEKQQQKKLVDCLVAAARCWDIVLHFNKGLAGARADVLEAAGDTAINPAALKSFALVICAAAEQPAYPGIPGHEPDLAAARAHAGAIARAMDEIRRLVPRGGSYVAESDFFEEEWQESFWGPNYPKLLTVKERYDPDGLFFARHGVGSERWNADGSTRLA